MMPPLPAIQGIDCSGIVETVGDNVSQFQPGQPVVVLVQGCYAKEQGMEHVINYKSEDVSARVKEITGGQGVNLILNSVAGDTFGRDFKLLAPPIADRLFRNSCRPARRKFVWLFLEVIYKFKDVPKSPISSHPCILTPAGLK